MSGLVYRMLSTGRAIILCKHILTQRSIPANVSGNNGSPKETLNRQPSVLRPSACTERPNQLESLAPSAKFGA